MQHKNNIVVIDRDNRKYDEMGILKDHHIEELVKHNFSKMQDYGRDVDVLYMSSLSEAEWVMEHNYPGYEREMNLYHRLVLEHNEKHPESLLDFWCRS